MDLQSNLEFLCRVCAGNTKGKNSVAECVYILKTIGLRDKLDRYLYLKVFENDALPKVLCKSCFRQVEATASLSKIAKHTQQVFRDFLFSTLPKGGGSSAADSNNSSEFTSSDFLSNKDTQKSQKNNEQMAITPVSIASLTQIKSPPPLQTIAASNAATPRKDEVIVNVSVSDPLTRENQQKVISNSQRRHSIMIDAATAASFAASPSAIPPTLAQKSQKNGGHSSSNSRKSSSPARVLQFCSIAPKTTLPHGQASQQATQITTFSSGGYVIGPMKPPSTDGAVANLADKEEATKKSATPLALTTAVNVNDNTILQQKRKNLVKALNNIKANNTGQISLLKSSQPKQQSLLQQQHQTPLVATSPTLELAKEVVTDELPDRIIIAAPKMKQSSSKSKKSMDNITTPSNPVAPSPAASPASTQVQPPPPKPSFPEDILLGRVIRDVDLLKLILKALKWPVNKQNMDMQLQRLKNSRFTDIMSDTNLLQDTDLTQLLGPYLAPVLLAAQALQQQQQQLLKNAASAAAPQSGATAAAPVNNANCFATPKPTILDPTTEEINKAIPYKLPPETSVQLVPALPEEAPASLHTTSSSNSATLLKRNLPKDTKSSSAPTAKRQRKSTIQKHRDSIVISDEDEEEGNEEEARKQSNMKQRVKPSHNFEIDLSNPSFLAQLGLIDGSSEMANEALLALLQKQKMAMTNLQKSNQQKSQQRKRYNSVSNFVSMPSNEFDALINIDDDIVLMEPVTTTTTPAAKQGSARADDTLKSQAQHSVQKDDLNFVMPAQVQKTAPLITRPIIKRRKTVIQSSRVTNNKEQAAMSSSTQNEEVKVEAGMPVPSFQDTTSNEEVADKAKDDIPSPSKSTQNEQVPSSAETSPTKQGSRKQHNKAALGQQLLEAIGLQKINSKPTALSLHYIPTTTNAVSTSGAATPKQSVQQIRSALKKSLKQAQEQQQMRNKEISSSVSTTVIQDADSTTKPAIKEIVIEHRSNKTASSSSSHVDVEEQIDKITLVKSQKPSTTNEPANDVETLSPGKDEEKKEEQQLTPQTQKKKTAGRITERRRTLPSSAGRGRPSLISKADKSMDNPAESVSEEKVEQGEKTKSEKDDADSLNISSSNITSTEVAQAKDDAAVTPRRRGRKRATEVVADTTETANSNDKQKDKEEQTEKDKDKEKEKEKENEKESSKQNTEKSKTLVKIKEEQEETSSNSGRPTRQSKTLSKYYKGPDKTVPGRRSLPSRSTRNRKYC